MSNSSFQTLDSKLLDKNFNPFYNICEHQLSPSSKFVEYRGFKDYLTYLKISGNRILAEYENYKSSNDDDTFIIYQLDILSFLIFARILLDRLSYLIQNLLGVLSAEYEEGFVKFKIYYIKNPTLAPSITELLSNTNWYETSLSLMRNKAIEHNILLSSSRRISEDGLQFRIINEEFGFLHTLEQAKIQYMIQKYGQKEKDILAIKSHRALMLDQFLFQILKHNTKLDKRDLRCLNLIVERCGCTLNVTALSAHLRKFLEDIASLFKEQACQK